MMKHLNVGKITRSFNIGNLIETVFLFILQNYSDTLMDTTSVVLTNFGGTNMLKEKERGGESQDL